MDYSLLLGVIKQRIARGEDARLSGIFIGLFFKKMHCSITTTNC
jgi:hypothetical protein